MRRELALWVLALLLLRGLFVVTLADVFFYGEELEKGAAAKAMLDGLALPHHQLAYHYYEGGGFVVSHLKALAFLLVGESLLAQRLCGLLTCLLVFLACWRLVDHHFGRGAARLAALGFLFGPASFQRYSLLSLGIHFEAMVFGLIVLDEGLRLVCDRDWTPGRLRTAAVGALAGFGLYFSWQNALVIAWVGSLLVVRRARWLLSTAGLVALAGFALGALPLAGMALLVGDAVLDVHGVDPTDLGPDPARLRGFFGAVYGDAGAFELVSLVLYPLAALVACGLSVAHTRGPRRTAAFALIGFALVWTAAWLFGPFLSADGPLTYFGWLRAAPLVLVVLILGAAGVDAARSRLGLGLAAAVLLLGATQSARILLEGRPTTPVTNARFLAGTKGYDYRGYLAKLLSHLDSLEVEDVRCVMGFDEEDPALLRADLAVALFENRRRRFDLGEQIALLERIDAEGRADFLRGLGAAVVVHNGGDPGRALRQVTGLDEPLSGQLAEAVGYFPGYRLETAARLLDEAAAHGRGALGPAYLRGLGARAFRVLVMTPFGREWSVDPAGVRALLARQEPDLARPLVEGFDAERARWTLP